ncbi:MAG: hypothetical protein K9G05_06875, partial [Candidatus Nanopelagicales bacterium]|nr:hypothetical protein [Candidatus Nanopelagicales bacterium]
MRSGLLGFMGAVLVASALGAPAAAVDLTPDPTRDPTPAATESPSPGVGPDPSTDPTPDPSTEPSTDPTPQDDPTDTDPFIVVAESGTSAQEIKARAVALGVPVETLLEGVIEGLAVDLTPEQRAELSVEPGVDYIERDAPVSVFSSAIRTDAGCTTTSMGNIDDASSGSVSLGFSVNWYGTAYDSIIINNNGGMTFDDGLGDFRSYTGMNLDTTLRPLVLPLFTDLDTRNSSPVTYGPITVDGKSAYCINWVNVGEYASSPARHSFQLVLINQGSGNVDLEFNYGQVTTPRSSSNPTFVIGYADPQDRNNSLVRVRNTDSPAPYIDGGSSALVSNRFPENAAQAGRYTYEIRPTVPLPTPPTPPSLPTPGAANCTPSAQTPATWGLDRIDQRSLPIDNSYTCAGD